MPVAQTAPIQNYGLSQDSQRRHLSGNYVNVPKDLALIDRQGCLLGHKIDNIPGVDSNETQDDAKIPGVPSQQQYRALRSGLGVHRHQDDQQRNRLASRRPATLNGEWTSRHQEDRRPSTVSG